MTRTLNRLILVLAATAMLAAPARAANIRDIARLKGARTNQLQGYGLVVGLRATGDGKSVQAARTLANLIQLFGSDVAALNNVNADNVALVLVTATIPETGAREGSALDVHVSAINGAKSLQGGRLVSCHMLGPMLDTQAIYALAQGAVVLENPAVPTGGRIRRGAVMEVDVRPEYVAPGGQITIVLDDSHSSWAIASTVANVINDAEGLPGDGIARAVDAGNIVVTIPPAERAAPADFIARVLGLPVLMPDLTARVVINRRTGTIVVTDDVEIDPCIISKSGLTITTIDPAPVATAEFPEVRQVNHLLIDPQQRASRKVRDLLRSFEQLQVPIDDQAAVLYELKRAGRLHAELVEE